MKYGGVFCIVLRMNDSGKRIDGGRVNEERKRNQFIINFVSKRGKGVFRFSLRKKDVVSLIEMTRKLSSKDDELGISFPKM